ncbi:MAG: hypothetical protein HC840_19425 [Leptolyngbyaceae cyanobacterium RM2_2_4]|nr:hypothetical protein [Leptolyngbyaceae cyanobacterium SM1_4_3]NJN91464.1 hypothetical protein [Leptolyngbyaceae cyanobacterium SL_5_14]NJO51251.1 hypothetical protein [Leptolyngbyaceae cyanobacterium RM2_2_4]
MTKLLEQVIAQLKALPDDEQDAIAARFLAEMEDEQRWKAQCDRHLVGCVMAHL